MTNALISPCDVLVVAAFAPELAAFREAVGGRGAATGALGALTVAVEAVGIGLPGAAVGATRVLARYAPRVVVLVGTCGAYDGGGLAIGDVVVAGALTLADAAVAEGRGAYPGPMARPLAADARIAAALVVAGGKAASVATTLAVTTDDGLAARLAAAFDASAEHLEAYAVARACEGASVPFVAALGVANRVGATGRDEWRANNVVAGGRAESLVLGWLRAGAPGLAEARE